MLQRAIYQILRPILRLIVSFPQGVLSPKLPKPLDAPHAHASGPNPDRILLYGSGPAVGYGVLSNELALPGQLARALSSITGRGVDVDVTAHSDIMIQSTIPELATLDLWRYDALVLTIGVKDVLVLTSLRAWRKATGLLFSYLDRELPQHTKVLVVAIPPLQETGVFARNTVWLADRHALLLNRSTKRATSGFPRITFVPFLPLSAVDNFSYQDASIYQHWARIIAAPLGQQLAELDRDRALRSLSASEGARQKALDDLNILDTEPEERFDRIVRLACQMLGVPAATISFVDHDRIWVKAQENFPFKEIPRGAGSSGYLPRTAAIKVIADMANSPRLSEHVLVYGPMHLRFYASYPIESAFGEPVGLMSVYGKEPRIWTDADTTLLRDLAIMVQRELSGE